MLQSCIQIKLRPLYWQHVNNLTKNKMALSLASIVAKYDDLSPWIFKIEKMEDHNHFNPQSLFQTQMSIYIFLIYYSPLLPKPLTIKIQEDFYKIAY